MEIFDRLFGRKKRSEERFEELDLLRTKRSEKYLELYGKEDSESKKPKFIQKMAQGSSMYEVYKGTDAESAKVFLSMREVDRPLYHIVVETPEGNWGRDIEGLYLERLLSWQTNINSAECEGYIVSLLSTFNLQTAAKGFNDNFTVIIECGKCGHQWLDGVRYQNITVVRCPKCLAFNKIDSTKVEVVESIEELG